MTKAQILDVTPDVKWIGILDPHLRIFDIIMETKYGTTYNSYFINAEKKAIIETAKETFRDDYLAKIQAVVNPEEISFIILNHTEPDHAGSLRNLLKLAPNATVVGSGNALRYLRDIVGHEFKCKVVKEGDLLDLGGKTLRFISAPNLHWPDSMYTWLEEDRLLFTCDSFGAHYCDERMFDDLVGDFDDAFKYYFDVILKPFSKFMLKAIDKIQDLPVNAICTGHGPILRKNWKKYVDLSEEYASEYLERIKPPVQRIFIPYVSAYGYTRMMAEKIAEGVLEAGNAEVEVLDIQSAGFNTLSDKLAASTGFIIGSPTINQNTLPQIYTLFSAMTPLRDKGKAAAAFGSYGWSGEAVDIIESLMNTMKLKVVQPGLKMKFRPHESSFEQLKEFGRNFAKNSGDLNQESD